jgi:hypothetical protein
MRLARLAWHCCVQKTWCERGDSNPHPLRDQILSLARLPIPPLSRTAIINQEGLINPRQRAAKAASGSDRGFLRAFCKSTAIARRVGANFISV